MNVKFVTTAETQVDRVPKIRFSEDGENFFVDIHDENDNVLGTVCMVNEAGVNLQPIPDTLQVAKDGNGFPVVNYP